MNLYRSKYCRRVLLVCLSVFTLTAGAQEIGFKSSQSGLPSRDGLVTSPEQQVSAGVAYKKEPGKLIRAQRPGRDKIMTLTAAELRGLTGVGADSRIIKGGNVVLGHTVPLTQAVRNSLHKVMKFTPANSNTHSLPFAVAQQTMPSSQMTHPDKSDCIRLSMSQISSLKAVRSNVSAVTPVREYNGQGIDYITKDSTFWKTTMAKTNDNKTVFVNPVPTTFTSMSGETVSMGDVLVEYVQEGNTITIPAQPVYELDDAGTHIYIFINSYSRKDGSIVMTLNSDGTLTTSTPENVMLSAWTSNNFDSTYKKQSKGGTYVGYYQYITNVKYLMDGQEDEGDPDESGFITKYTYNARGLDVDDGNTKWTAALGLKVVDGKKYNAMRNVLPNLFTSFMDNVDVYYTRSGNEITIPVQGIISGTATNGQQMYCFMNSLKHKDGSIHMTISDTGRLTTEEADTIMYSLFSADAFDPEGKSVDEGGTYLGYYITVVNPRYSIPGDPDDVDDEDIKTVFTAKYSYTAKGNDLKTSTATSWTAKYGTITYGSQSSVALRDIVPNAFSSSVENIDVYATLNGNTVTIPAQTVLQGKDSSGNPLYVILSSYTSTDGSITMTLGSDGALALTNPKDTIIYGLWTSKTYDPTFLPTTSGGTFYGLYAATTAITYTLGSTPTPTPDPDPDPDPSGDGFTLERRYIGTAKDYSTKELVQWTMQKGTLKSGDNTYNVMRNPLPLPSALASSLSYVEVQYSRSGNEITIPSQVIAKNSSYYVLICSTLTNDGSIQMTIDDNGKLTTTAGEEIMYGAWSKPQYDYYFENFLGWIEVEDNVKYYRDGDPIVPEMQYEPNGLYLHVCPSETGYQYARNMAVVGADAEVAFTNTTTDAVQTYAWSVTPVDVDEATAQYTPGTPISGTTQDFSYTTIGGQTYLPAELRGTYNDNTSEPYAWATAAGYNGYTPYVFAGGASADYVFNDGSTATLSKVNPDNGLSYFGFLATPGLNTQGYEFEDLIMYQGKPEGPFYMEGVRLLVHKMIMRDGFTLTCQIRKAQRDDTGSLTLGDVLAESSTPTSKEKAGFSYIDFSNFYTYDSDGLTSTVDHLFLNDEFAVVLKGWNNGTFDCYPYGENDYNGSGVTSTYVVLAGNDGKISSFSSLYEHIMVGFTGASYGFLRTDEASKTITLPGNTTQKFSKAITVQPMYCNNAGTSQASTRLFLDEETGCPDWLHITVDNAEYSRANDYECSLRFTADEMPSNILRRTANVTLYQEGAQLTIAVTQDSRLKDTESHADAIESVEVKPTNTATSTKGIYTLTGMRVNNTSAHGIYIIGGKKIAR